MKKLINHWPGILIGIGFLLILVFVVGNILHSQPNGPSETEGQAQTATAVPEPETSVVPTKTTAIVQTTPQAQSSPTMPAQETSTPVATEDPQPDDAVGLFTTTPTPAEFSCSPDFCMPRIGTSGRIEVISAAYEAGLPVGNYLNWRLEVDPLPVGSAEFWQMIRVSEDGIRQDWEEIALVVEANPGSIWIIGNEPDILWQDNTTAERYAERYHDAYQFIRERDPTAQIAVAGVGQPTPLRLAYLDTVLETYEQRYGQPMPVDIWTIHNFILREERDSWGVGIPPGMVQESGLPVDEGVLYEITDHNDLEIFRQNLVNFRQWMADRGYRDRPLAVTEFGILMPVDFGFPPPVVAEFMTGALDFLMQASDESIGYPADGNRLIQWAFWYSVFDPAEFPTGNLYDPETEELTVLGETYVEYINGN